jgi:hypothetical protein
LVLSGIARAHLFAGNAQPWAYLSAGRAPVLAPVTAANATWRDAMRFWGAQHLRKCGWKKDEEAAAMSEHEPLPAVTEAQLAAQIAALDAQLDALCSGITRLRASHDALLAAANVVLSCTAMRTLDWGDPVLETLRAAISKAEEAAHDPRCRWAGRVGLHPFTDRNLLA